MTLLGRIFRRRQRSLASTQPALLPATVPAGKPWYRSRTLWFNLLVSVAFAAEATLGLLAPLLGELVYPLLAFALALGNAVLRVLTTMPLALGRHPEEGYPPEGYPPHHDACPPAGRHPHGGGW